MQPQGEDRLVYDGRVADQHSGLQLEQRFPAQMSQVVQAVEAILPPAQATMAAGDVKDASAQSFTPPVNTRCLVATCGAAVLLAGAAAGLRGATEQPGSATEQPEGARKQPRNQPAAVGLNVGPRLSVAQIQTGNLSSRALCEYYLQRIRRLDSDGPELNSVIELNPEALALADALDQEREEGILRGPLHGVPILLKDNIDTEGLLGTTAGSLALMSSRAPQDSLVASKLRDAGAVILGKANLSEWANFRSYNSFLGWSARGGQCKNPYNLKHSPGSSSSGSAVAVAADLCTVSLGTETDGSILNPANWNGVVGIKPTVGLTSRGGVVPISDSQDTVGPFGRCVRDAALVLTAIAGSVDPRDPKTDNIVNQSQPKIDYAAACNPEHGLKGAKIGVPKKTGPYWGYAGEEADGLCEAAIAKLEAAGAHVVRDVDLPWRDALVDEDGNGELQVLLHEFRVGIEAYLATREADPVPGEDVPPVKVPETLADIVEFNNLHADKELHLFGQEIFQDALDQEGTIDEAKAKTIQATISSIARRALNKALKKRGLDALVCPTCSPSPLIGSKLARMQVFSKFALVQKQAGWGDAYGLSAVAGWPAISMPVGQLAGNDIPVSVSFFGRAFSEAKLIELASAFEYHCVGPLPPPEFLDE